MPERELSLSLNAIRKKSFELGYDDAAATVAEISQENIAAYERWITADHHADMHYMKRRERLSPQEYYSGAKCALLLVSYYKQPPAPFMRDRGVVASYARGRDYHNVHRRRLKKLIRWIEEEVGSGEVAIGFSDSSPVMEKALAVQSGLAWFGKNTLLIHRKFGTFFLLSGLFTRFWIDGTAVHPRLPKCGSCQRCLDACPTGALISPYALDANLCLSYQLIENRTDSVPAEIAAKNPGYAFGCDICQNVCPHNFRTPLAQSEDFAESRGVGPYLEKEQLDAWIEQPERLYGTPLTRCGVKGLRRNLETFSAEK